MREQTITINSPVVSEELVEFFKGINFQHWNDIDHTTTRDARYGYTIIPTPIKIGNAPTDLVEDTRETVGWHFVCLVPEDFIAPKGVTISATDAGNVK
jgi:hypothetical protein